LIPRRSQPPPPFAYTTLFRSVHVPKPKGGTDRRRTVGISEDAIEAVDRWMVERAKLAVGPSAPLFCGIKGKGRGNRLLPSYVRRDRKSTRLNSSHGSISYAVC